MLTLKHGRADAAGCCGAQAAPLEGLARAALHLRLHACPGAGITDWPRLLNAALESVQADVEGTLGSMAARWHWPPPELSPGASAPVSSASPATSTPSGWWAEDCASAVRSSLQAAILPPLPWGDEQGTRRWCILHFRLGVLHV